MPSVDKPSTRPAQKPVLYTTNPLHGPHLEGLFSFPHNKYTMGRSQSPSDGAALDVKEKYEDFHINDRDVSQDEGRLEAAAAANDNTQQFDPAAESKLRLKIDFAIMPWISLIYLLSFIDRANIGNARIAGLEKDLGMKGRDYSICLSVFFISYTLFEIPANMLCKVMGPGWFIPIITIGFGIATITTAYVRDFSALCGVRFVLGFMEAGMMPSIVFYLSRWYRRSELTFRASLFITTASLAGAFGGLLASAILELPHFASVHSWRMIFVIEGIVTTVLGVICLATLTDRPETARWLTAEEKILAVARVKSERLQTAELNDKFTWKKFRRGIINPVVLPTCLIMILNSITVYGLSFFLPTIVRSIFPDRTVRDQQLLTVPPYAVGSFMCLAISYVSWRMDKRGIFLIFLSFFAIVGHAMYLGAKEATLRYGATFLPVCGIFVYGALSNSLVSASVVSDTARSTAVAVNAMGVSLGGIISTWIYLPNDGPGYPVGNGVNLAAQGTLLIVAICQYFWIEKDNKRRELRNVEEELAGKSLQEIQDMDWKHPAFRWHN